MSVIQTQRGTAAALAATNPVIADGQIVYETDTRRFKVGDGVTAWNSLAYQSVTVSQISDIAALTNNTTSSADAFSRIFTNSGQTPTSGNVHWTYFTPASSFTASQISITNIVQAYSPTLIRLGLYTADSAGGVTLVARTANDTTVFSTTSTYWTRSFATAGGYPATYAVTAGSRYALAFCITASSMPTIPAFSGHSLYLWQTPRITAYITGQSDLPSSVASDGFATVINNQAFWMRLS